MVDFTSIFTSPSEISPLFFWIVLSYFIFLFFSFNIEEIKSKITGLEVLLISAASGVLFYYFIDLLKPVIIEPLFNWYANIDTAISLLPFAPNPVLPGLMTPGSTSSDYIAIGLFLFAILYFIYAALFFVYIRIIKFCLDPAQEIFQTYKRFSILKRYNVIRFFALGIPIIIIFIGLVLLISSVLYGYLSNILFFGYTPRGIFTIIISLLWTGLSILSIIILITTIYCEFELFLPILSKLKSVLANYKRKYDEFVNISRINNNKISIFIMIHIKFIYFMMICLGILIIIQYIVFPISCTESYCIWQP